MSLIYSMVFLTDRNVIASKLVNGCARRRSLGQFSGGEDHLNLVTQKYRLSIMSCHRVTHEGLSDWVSDILMRNYLAK